MDSDKLAWIIIGVVILTAVIGLFLVAKNKTGAAYTLTTLAKAQAKQQPSYSSQVSRPVSVQTPVSQKTACENAYGMGFVNYDAQTALYRQRMGATCYALNTWYCCK